MNKQEAKKLNEFLGELSLALIDKLVDVGLLDSNVLANYRAGYIKAFSEGKDVRLNGEKYDTLSFLIKPPNYSIHEPKIDGEKAIKNGAWGEEFMFTNGGEWCGPFRLWGYDPCRGYYLGGVVTWEQCKPVEGEEIPKEWLKDETVQWLARKMIRVNGIEVPAPESEAPEDGAIYYLTENSYEERYNTTRWRGDDFDLRALERGLVYLNTEDAIERAKAMEKFEECSDEQDVK